MSHFLEIKPEYDEKVREVDERCKECEELVRKVGKKIEELKGLTDYLRQYNALLETNYNRLAGRLDTATDAIDGCSRNDSTRASTASDTNGRPIPEFEPIEWVQEHPEDSTPLTANEGADTLTRRHVVADSTAGSDDDLHDDTVLRSPSIKRRRKASNATDDVYEHNVSRWFDEVAKLNNAESSQKAEERPVDETPLEVSGDR